MFGRKARRIKDLGTKIKNLEAVIGLMDTRERVALEERDQLREKLGQQLSSALADRDQFAKRCEELEEKITRMLLDRQAAREADKPAPGEVLEDHMPDDTV